MKYLDPAEFQSLGFLQEVNRLVLHPCGLALSVAHAEDGTVTLGPIWDERDDPEGIYFGGDYSELFPHAQRVAALRDSKRSARRASLGYIVQPPI
jgi:hypothetical protein